MKSKTVKTASVYIFSLIIMFICGLDHQLNAQQKSDSKILITIEREACFGSCPIYSAQISNDGTVIFEGKDYVKIIGKKSYKISKDKINGLKSEFNKADYFSFKDEYRYDEKGMSYTDLPTTTTSFSFEGKQKKVINYYSAPKKLEELENKIEELAELNEFIGPI